MTNAVMHAHGPFRFGIDAMPDVTRIEGWDHSPETAARPCRNGHDPEDVGGWGMNIVERFSSGWGTSRNGDWKCTWSEVPASQRVGSWPTSPLQAPGSAPRASVE